MGHRVERDETQHSWVILRQVVDGREGRLGREANRGGGEMDFARLRGRARRCLEFGSSAKASWLRGRRRKSLDGVRSLDQQRSGDVGLLALLLLGRGRGRVKVVAVVSRRRGAYSRHVCGAGRTRFWSVRGERVVRQGEGFTSGRWWLRWRIGPGDLLRVVRCGDGGVGEALDALLLQLQLGLTRERRTM